MKTARLSLTLLSESDINDVLAMLLEKGMFEYIKPHEGKPDQYYLDFLSLKLEQIKSGKGFYWLVKDNNMELAGSINLTPIPGTGEQQIGWLIKKKFRGQGFAYEAAKLVLDFAKKETNFNPIYGVFESKNVASEKILTKLNFEFHNSFVEDGVIIKKFIYQG